MELLPAGILSVGDLRLVKKKRPKKFLCGIILGRKLVVVIVFIIHVISGKNLTYYRVL
jgi:hypothetical protein